MARRRSVPKARQRGRNRSTGVVLAVAAAVVLGGVGVAAFLALDGSGDPGTPDAEAPTDGGTSSGQLADALMRGENFPGYTEEPVTAPIGSGPGLCGGKGEAEIRTPTETAATTVVNSEDMLFVYQALFAYASEEDADAVIDQIREDGTSCRAYDVEPEEGETIRYEVDPASFVLPAGWDEIASFSGRVGTVEAPSAELSLSFVRLGEVMMVMSVSAPTAEDASDLLARILTPAAEQVSEILA